MQLATSEGLAGIIAECGGVLSCATCHVHVDPVWYEKLKPARQNELDMLQFAEEPGPTGRLACQLRITEALDGLEVTIPSKQ